jgi:CubicO group peptidase (beta-lactamase class C family)
MSDVQEQVQAAVDDLVSSGAERGLQVSVYLGGEQIVDAVAGLADPETDRPMTAATPVYCFSVVKGALSTMVHILVERGLFTDDTPVAELWPEFAAHGKAGVTVRHVLTQTAGVPGVPLDTTVEDVCDWDHMCAAIADAEPWWEPGTKIGYHAYTFGYILGEVVRRATDRPLSEVLRSEVTEPLGVADELYFGMPRSEHGRLARLEDAPGAAEMMASMPPDLPMFRAGPPSLFPDAAFGNRADTLAADIPAGGKCTARAIARMYAALLGEVDGVRLISPERLAQVSVVAHAGTDEVFGMPTAWGLGFGIGMPGPSAFGVGGVGGNFAYGDPTTGVSFGLTKNRLTSDFNAVGTIGGLVQQATGGATG